MLKYIHWLLTISKIKIWRFVIENKRRSQFMLFSDSNKIKLKWQINGKPIYYLRPIYHFLLSSPSSGRHFVERLVRSKPATPPPPNAQRLRWKEAWRRPLRRNLRPEGSPPQVRESRRRRARKEGRICCFLIVLGVL